MHFEPFVTSISSKKRRTLITNCLKWKSYNIHRSCLGVALYGNIFADTWCDHMNILCGNERITFHVCRKGQRIKHLTAIHDCDL